MPTPRRFSFSSVLLIALSSFFLLLSCYLALTFQEFALASWRVGAAVASPLALAICFLAAIRAPLVARINIAASAICALSALYLFEIMMQFGFFQQTPYVMGAMLPDADQRSVSQVVADLRKEGKDAYPSVFPTGLYEHRGDRTYSRLGSLLPLGGISNVTTVLCNETGRYMIYPSDEYGFNNPAGLWSLPPVCKVVSRHVV
jgi:hypothetical protein